jgi:CubicO group peptidase (beta-lactamase class C family)
VCDQSPGSGGDIIQRIYGRRGIVARSATLSFDAPAQTGHVRGIIAHPTGDHPMHDADLTKQLQRAIRRYGVPGASVALSSGHRILAAAAAGVTNVDTRVPVTLDTVFQIGSITKVFTTTLIMQLVDEGLLSLDTPVIRCLPEFRIADKSVQGRVTVRHLLSHTSGIDGDFFPDSGRGDDAIERFIDQISMVPSLYPPGERMSYCNVGFAVLGRIIEVLRRQTWDRSMRKCIFEPLEMQHAMTLPEDALRHRCAVGHVPHPKKPDVMVVAPVTHLSHGQKSAGSTPAMSTADLLKFAWLHIDRGRAADGARVLSAAATRAMQRREVALPRHMPFAIDGWGLGWILSDWSGHRVIGHDGGTVGQYSFLRISPSRRVAMALLTNGGNAIGLYRELVDELFGARIRRREPQLSEPAPNLRIDPARYVGRYENIAGAYDVTARRGALTLSVTPTDGIGLGYRDAPIAFIDRNAAVLRSGNPIVDRTVLHFSPPEDGRSRFMQVGLRQLRRVD